VRDIQSKSGTFLNTLRLSPSGQDSKPFKVRDLRKKFSLLKSFFLFFSSSLLAFYLLSFLAFIFCLLSPVFCLPSFWPSFFFPSCFSLFLIFYFFLLFSFFFFFSFTFTFTFLTFFSFFFFSFLPSWNQTSSLIISAQGWRHSHLWG